MQFGKQIIKNVTGNFLRNQQVENYHDVVNWKRKTDMSYNYKS